MPATAAAKPAAFAQCLCSHTQRRHHDGDGDCQAGSCGCHEFRPTGSPQQLVQPAAAGVAVSADAPPQPTPAAPVRAPAAGGASIFDRAAGSKYLTTRQLGERAQRAVTQLRERLRMEEERDRLEEQRTREEATTQKEIAELKQRLAELRGRLGGEHRATRGKPQQCEHCPAKPRNEAGLSAHMRSRHREILAAAKAARVAELARAAGDA